MRSKPTPPTRAATLDRLRSRRSERTGRLARAALIAVGIACTLVLACRERRELRPEERSLVLTTEALAKGPRSIVLILCDDHRADALGFLGHPVVDTPHLDRLAAGGVHCRNAFVTTSLCSPSRASILTGLHAHSHGVVDNYHPVSKDLFFFPEALQSIGVRTAFIGKWHMGDEDTPQRGFDHWVAFRGQGTYWPDGHGTTRVVPQTRYDGFNVNGTRVPQKGYITDELTDHAVEWLEQRPADEPFFLYVSHKAVHSDFVPADRHEGRYRDRPMPRAPTREPSEAWLRNRPRWVQDQRNSRHGAEFGYNLDDFDLETYQRRYFETLCAVDDSVGRILDTLERTGRLDSTLVVYLGDNGFHLGEHGLIDKRTAYETSMRIPMLLHCPDALPGGTTLDAMVANIDLAPTLLEAAGDRSAGSSLFHGRSFWRLAQGESHPWRDALLYEYAWEWNYPYTPTIHAVRTDRYKYVRPHGVWDLDELYDLERDPDEMHNLAYDLEHAATRESLKERLFELLEETDGRSMPLLPDRGRQFYHRHSGRSAGARFPATVHETPAPVTR